MMQPKIFIAATVSCVSALTSAALATDLPVVDARPEFQKQATHNPDWIENQCLKPKKNNIWCRRNAAYHVADFFFLGDYRRSMHYLEVFDNLWADNYYYVKVDPCPYIDFTTKITKPGINYIFGSAQARYAIELAQKKPDAKKSGLRAFLCSLVSYGFDMRMNLTEYRFNRNNFKEFIRKYYGDDVSMDPDLFLNEIQEPAQIAQRKIVGNHRWGVDWKRDTSLHVKLAELYKNAKRHCGDVGLSSKYCEFLGQMANMEREVAASLAKDGEIE